MSTRKYKTIRYNKSDKRLIKYTIIAATGYMSLISLFKNPIINLMFLIFKDRTLNPLLLLLLEKMEKNIIIIFSMIQNLKIIYVIDVLLRVRKFEQW